MSQTRGTPPFPNCYFYTFYINFRWLFHQKRRKEGTFSRRIATRVSLLRCVPATNFSRTYKTTTGKMGNISPLHCTCPRRKHDKTVSRKRLKSYFLYFDVSRTSFRDLAHREMGGSCGPQSSQVSRSRTPVYHAGTTFILRRRRNRMSGAKVPPLRPETVGKNKKSEGKLRFFYMKKQRNDMCCKKEDLLCEGPR